MALEASAKNKEDAKISHRALIRALTEMQSGKPQDSIENLEVNDKGEVSLYQAALCLMDVLVHMAIDYSSDHGSRCSFNVGVDSIEKSDIYVWGSNSSHQLSEGNQEKISVPVKSKTLNNVQQAEAGQYCTFIIHWDGSVSACGKGSYGRLGLGDSSNQSMPKRVLLDVTVKKLSSSKGSDGHTLALTENGQVYSWGDGDYGKLGHGNCSTQKKPKCIGGPLLGKVIKYIHAGKYIKTNLCLTCMHI